MFNTLWRLIFGFPVAIALFLFLVAHLSNEPIESKSIIFLVFISSVNALICLSIIFIAYKKNKRSDIYTFYITDTRVVSKYPSSPPHKYIYDIELNDIKELSKYTTDTTDNLDVTYKIITFDNRAYEISSNYFSPSKVFRILKKLKPYIKV